ncbi:MAG TPA: Maf family protein [Myxococcota bacterium]|nr:Maf family protein [Myxococcota bacterium]
MLVLASASPRRKELLAMAGVSFIVIPAGIAERPLPGEGAGSFSARAAREKAQAVRRREASAWVLGADTTVVLDGAILGKPADENEAGRMLRALSGREHRVLTAVALLKPDGALFGERLLQTRVRFRRLSEALIECYTATGEPRDKAGAYGIQGRGAMLVESIDGSYTNIVGLPLPETLEMLEDAGLWQPLAGGAKNRTAPMAARS